MNNLEDKFDGILLKMVEDAKGYEGFFDIVFSMLRRRTDFFSNQPQAEKIIAQAGKTHIMKYKQDEEQKKKEEQTQLERKKEKEREIAEKRRQAQEALDKQRQEEKDKAKAEGDTENKMPEFKVTGKKEPNDMNGGNTEKYVWGQTLDQVDITINLKSNVKSKDLIVELGTNKIRVAKKNLSEVYLEGEWFEKINSEDSFWTLETAPEGKNLVINITKVSNQDKWWDCVVKNGPKIDTSKVNPASSKLSDLDGDMRGEVEKMMFDMRQKQMGKPNSDELKKQEMLEKIMKANPDLNLDFSKARFN
jgi:hypothetical protein